MPGFPRTNGEFSGLPIDHPPRRPLRSIPRIEIWPSPPRETAQPPHLQAGASIRRRNGHLLSLAPL